MKTRVLRFRLNSNQDSIVAIIQTTGSKRGIEDNPVLFIHKHIYTEWNKQPGNDVQVWQQQALWLKTVTDASSCTNGKWPFSETLATFDGDDPEANNLNNEKSLSKVTIHIAY